MSFPVLFVGAHPDDETVLVGGTFGMLTQRGHWARVVCATRGEGGELGEPPVVADRSLLGAAREQELRCACRAIGAELTLLGYQDPVIGPDEAFYPFQCDYDTFVGQIREQILAIGAAVVLSHGSDGEYGHPAHQLTHRATLDAVRSLDHGVLMYSVAAMVPGIEDRLWNQSDPAQLALNIEPWQATKLAAMACHASQHALFKRRRKLTDIRDALRRVESFHRQWPSGEGAPADRFAQTLLAAGAWRPE